MLQRNKDKLHQQISENAILLKTLADIKAKGVYYASDDEVLLETHQWFNNY